MNKCLFIVLALFGLSAFADVHDKGMDHMSNMMGSEGASDHTGSFSLRYKPMGFEEEGVDELTYRARIGWKNNVNEAVSWALGLSTATEQNFEGIGLGDINLEEAYVKYSPMDGVSVKVGKYGWKPNFHQAGVLYSEQLYKTGAMLKYHHSMSDTDKVYVKVGAYKLSENAPLADGVTVKAKVGGKVTVSDGMMAGLYVGALHDGLMKDEGNEANTLAQVGLNIDASMAVPVGFTVNYLTSLDGLTDFDSYSATLSVGNAGTACSNDAGDFGLALNYYNITADSYVASWLNEDYVAGVGEGVAVRAQYNVWDNTSLVAKFAHDLAGGDDANNLVTELTFAF